MHRAAEATILNVVYRFQGDIVEGDEKVFAEKKIKLTCGEYSVGAAVIDGVDHDEKIRGEQISLLRQIFVHLRGGRDF
jgi:hypothetical protein